MHGQGRTIAAAEPRLGVFVSYSHADGAAWLRHVQVHLTQLVRAGRVELLDDTRIRSGERWLDEIGAHWLAPRRRCS